MAKIVKRKKQKKFSQVRFEKENTNPRKAYFIRVFGLFSGFVKKIEIFQKKACNYKKGMVLFNSSLREIQNSETQKRNMAPWSSG